MILGIETDIRGISTGDSIETALEKIGISPLGARLMADSGTSFYIGADNSIDGGFGWMRAEEGGSTHHGIAALSVSIGFDEYICQMDFIEDRLISLYINPKHI